MEEKWHLTVLAQCCPSNQVFYAWGETSIIYRGSDESKKACQTHLLTDVPFMNQIIPYLFKQSIHRKLPLGGATQ